MDAACTRSYAFSLVMPASMSAVSTVPEKTSPRDEPRFSSIRSGRTSSESTMPRNFTTM